ncbi:MAG: diacylglycerol kinase [Planctomycetia bacterium]|nr:diacylglycerol kinase [Planctomycetia bacterium]
MPSPFQKPPFTWRRKFGYAFRGLAVGVRGERSFIVHFTAAIAVIVAAGLLGCTLVEWCVLFIAIGGVLTAEVFNRAIERLASAITSDENADIRDALDIAAGAVLMASATSVVVGLAVLGYRVWLLSLTYSVFCGRGL